MPAPDLSAVSRLVVVAAHPDDETLGAGGLIATAHRAGIAVTVLMATLGEKSHPHSPTHTQEELAQRRRAEMFAAVGALDPTANVRVLGLPDGELSANSRALAVAVRECVDGPSTMVVAPWSGDGHPDHEAAGLAAAQAVSTTGGQLLQYPIWAWHWAGTDQLPAGLVRLDLTSPVYEAKRQALERYPSQTQALSAEMGDEPIVGPDMAAHFERPYEIFVAGDDTPGSSATGESLTQGFFDDFYDDRTDPWGFETRWYEKRKRAITMATLPRERFRSAFEPGCSIGVLTAELATRCDRILATDISDLPLRTARKALAAWPGIRIQQRRIPQDWPDEKFDLIVLSEVGYYCGVEDLRLLVERAADSLTEDGVLLACHWRHPVADYPLRGDDVYRALRAERNLAVLAEHREEDFLLGVYSRPPAISVARATGLVK